MRRYLIIFIFLLFSKLAAANPLSFLGEQLQKAKSGDYILTLQSGNYSLLYVQACDSHHLVLQEITVPESLINLKTIEWSDWMQNLAPGHTSWMMFEIDLQEGCLQESYDLSKKQWLYLEAEDHLLVKLLHLPMKKLSDQDRRRIGPPPSAGDPDHRALWNPPQVLENSIGKNQTTVWRATWPSDKSLLAGSKLDLYYDLRQSDFPFPVGIDIQSTHYKAHLRVVKAGRNLEGLTPQLPRRPPRFLSHLNPGYTEYKIRVQCPRYYRNFQLLAVPVGSSDSPIPLPFKLYRGEACEELIFAMTRQELDPVLKKGCRYRLAFIATPRSESYIETDATFVW